jgi:hypothetical protein
MGWFDDDEDESAEQAASADPGTTSSAWGSAVDTIGGWVDSAEAKASEFAQNAQTQFEADPVGFVGTLGGAPIVTYDDDSSDGTLAFHVKGAVGNIDADWKDGVGSQVHAQAGMDWGSAPYLKTDLVTDDQGEITQATGTAKVTIPLGDDAAKADWAGGYQKTADGYNVTYAQNVGASVDGIEMMGGVHGGYQDHGEHGYNVTAGPQVSVGTGKAAIAPGFDIAEGGFKTSGDLSYGEQDGQSTVGASDTTTLEGKVFGQTVVQANNQMGVQYTDGPQGEQVIVSDTLSGTVGTQTTGQVSGSTGAAFVTGTDAAGQDVDQLRVTDQGTITAPDGSVTAGSDSVTIDLDDPQPHPAPEWVNTAGTDDGGDAPADDGGPVDGSLDDASTDAPADLDLGDPGMSVDSMPMILIDPDLVDQDPVDQPVIELQPEILVPAAPPAVDEGALDLVLDPDLDVEPISIDAPPTDDPIAAIQDAVDLPSVDLPTIELGPDDAGAPPDDVPLVIDDLSTGLETAGDPPDVPIWVDVIPADEPPDAYVDDVQDPSVAELNEPIVLDD